MSDAPYSVAATAGELQRNFDAVRRRIAGACSRVSRDPAVVRLLPVSKTVGADRIRLAHAAGMHEFGENKIQEARSKAGDLADLALRWSVIGHLQSNKTKFVARFAHEIQSLDSLKLAEQLDKRLQLEGRAIDVFIQVNSSGEPSKYGLAPEAVPGLLREMPAFSSLRVRGLMTLAALSSNVVRVRSCFQLMRRLQDSLRAVAPDGCSLEELSMGMSGDFEVAVEEGATVVRVGQAIFGKRPIPDSHYWPE